MIILAVLISLLIDAIISTIVAFPIGALLYWIITCATGLLPALTFWTWYGIAFAFSFIVYIFIPSKK